MSRKVMLMMSSSHQFTCTFSLFPTFSGKKFVKDLSKPFVILLPIRINHRFFRKFTSMQSSPGPNMANSLQQLEMLRLVLGMSQGNGNGAFGSQDAQALLKDNIPQLLQILKMSNELNNQQGQQPNSAIVTPQESPVTVASNDSCCSPQKDVSTVSSQDGDEDETTKSSPGN